MDKLLDFWEKEKKDNHCKKYHKQRTHFSLFVLSIYGILRKEALVVLSNLSRLVAEKTEEPISHVCGWVNGWIKIAATRSLCRMIYGARD